MAGNGFELDKGLQQWQRWLMNMQAKEVDIAKDRILRNVGFRVLEYTQDGTPVRTTRLKSSFSVGDEDNIFQVKVGKTSYVFVGTAVGYAVPINDGFQQKKGQFVPGFWVGKTFHYYPYEGAVYGPKVGGMVLTGKLIPGAHMMDKAVENVKDDLPTIFEFEFRRLYEQLF